MTYIVGVDVGGTFTDFSITDIASGRSFFYKRPSTPTEPHRAIVDGLKEALELHDIPAENIEALLHGTTVGTNALIQRKVGKVALVTTDGFRDLIEIGRQVRPKVYDIHEDFPAPIVPRDRRFEVVERMRANGDVHLPLSEAGLLELVPSILASGAESVVVCLLHSYRYPAHERRAVEILRSALPSEIYVIASTDVYPEFREYERFTTAVLNGALLTVIDKYLDKLTGETQQLGVMTEPRISHSNGGLMSVNAARTFPIRASLSGPAAGVAGVLNLARLINQPKVITLDVGGTSSDVTLIRDFAASEIAVQDIGGFPVRLPTLDISAVGAGGGTIAWIDSDDLLKVGPHSAGADPGPACYDRGSEHATVTDANVFLGRLNNSALLDGRMPIEASLSQSAIGQLAERLGLKIEETALGILRVAAATVVKAIRKISVERGHNPAEFTLFAFGGAGPLLAVDVARELGIGSVVVPNNPGLMCAEGLQHCALMQDFVHSTLTIIDNGVFEPVVEAAAILRAEADAWFDSENVASEDRRLLWRAELRYLGQNFELVLPIEGDTIEVSSLQDLRDRFHALHDGTYGFASPEEPVELVTLRLKASEATKSSPHVRPAAKQPGKPEGQRSTMFDKGDRVETPIYRRSALAAGQVVAGPAIVEQQDTTILVYPGDVAHVDDWGNLTISLGLEDAV